jgi:hypothetical protein
VQHSILDGAPEWITDFPPTFHLQSKGNDKQTAAMVVNIAQFSRPALHFRIKSRRTAEAIHVYVCHLKSKAPTVITSDPWYKEKRERYSIILAPSVAHCQPYAAQPKRWRCAC